MPLGDLAGDPERPSGAIGPKVTAVLAMPAIGLLFILQPPPVRAPAAAIVASARIAAAERTGTRPGLVAGLVTEPDVVPA